MVGVVSAKDCEVRFFDIFDARSYKLSCIKGPPIQISGRGSTSSYSHDVMLMVHVIVFELDGIWIDYVFLIDDDFLAILIMVGEA